MDALQRRFAFGSRTFLACDTPARAPKKTLNESEFRRGPKREFFDRRNEVLAVELQRTREARGLFQIGQLCSIQPSIRVWSKATFLRVVGWLRLPWGLVVVESEGLLFWDSLICDCCFSRLMNSNAFDLFIMLIFILGCFLCLCDLSTFSARVMLPIVRMYM